MLMVFFLRYVSLPAVNEALQARNQLANVRSSLQNMAAADTRQVRHILNTEKQMIDTYLQEINRLLPDYQSSRISAIANLESLREKYAGNWQFQPSTQPNVSENIIKWPVRINYEGSFIMAVKAMEAIENEIAMNRIISADINNGRNAEIELTVHLELLFRNSAGQTQQQAYSAASINGVEP